MPVECKALEDSKAEINSLEAGLAAISELLEQIDLGKAKDHAILTTVRLWGVNDDVKMCIVNDMIDAETQERISALLAKVEGYSKAEAQRPGDVSPGLWQSAQRLLCPLRVHAL